MKTQAGEPQCKLITLTEVSESRGALCFADSEKEIPFPIKRVFWIYDVPTGATRGQHANWKCAEVIFPLHGAFDITIDDGRYHKTYHLDTPSQGILIPAGVWCELKNFQAGTVCMVCADQSYSEEYYVNDYQQYLEERRCR